MEGGSAGVCVNGTAPQGCQKAGADRVDAAHGSTPTVQLGPDPSGWVAGGFTQMHNGVLFGLQVDHALKKTIGSPSASCTLQKITNCSSLRVRQTHSSSDHVAHPFHNPAFC